MGSLKGKVAIVTGAGRPRGMGRAVSLKLAQQGAHVVVTDIVPTAEDQRNLESVAGEVRALGVKALGVPLDVTDPSQVDACLERTMEAFGHIDILFNNAGVGTPGVGPFLEITPERWNQTWQVNVMGMVHLCRAVIPGMVKQGGGSIVNNSSLAGLGVIAGMAAYSASKYAVIGLTKSIAAEFATDGIRCNAICPGMVRTDMGRQEIQWTADLEDMTPEEAEEWLLEPVAMKRWAEPEEVAEVVAFLVSSAASYLTGIAIPVAGGLPAGL